MTSQDQDAPENVTPLGTMLAGFVLYVAVAAMAWFGGSMDGQRKAWDEMEATQQATSEQTTETLRLANLLAPYLWLLDCNPDPVANISLPDESRAIVSLRCDLGVQVPESIKPTTTEGER